VLAVALLLAAVLVHEPSGVVLAAPFLVVSVWSLLTRPTAEPTLRHPRRLPTLREGEAVRWYVQLSVVPGLDHAGLVFEHVEHQNLRPESGQCAAAADPVTRAPLDLVVEARSTRWGHQQVGRSLVAASSSWGAFLWGPALIDPLDQVTLPMPEIFDLAAPPPHPVGLVGLNRSARPGDGNEFATIRPFQIGDRLRRVHWPTSLRTGTVHVTSTWADQDAEIMLMVDASSDLGTSEGIDGYASSLDVTVRAAGAVAEHFLRNGERVGMCVFGPSVLRMRPAAGHQQLRRMLYRLADTKVGNRSATTDALLRLRLNAGATVVMLSACVSKLALYQAAVLAARGLSVIVVDTLPEQIGGIHNDALLVAWRVRRLERDAELRGLERRGVPVVPWRGAGSLDVVLRDLGRRSAAPRMARR
jgi:uncharacterized protein (DUF58 family)